ncbi:choice-of-anchor A family protein, partial [Emticicia sp. ODNR4P]|nr:choice-of-anchor A family protein [Emticicia sp. ODNR4P]
MKNFTASLRTSSKCDLSKLCTPELNTFRRARHYIKNHANGILRIVLLVPLIFFLGGTIKSQAQQNPLSPVQGFNIFAYGNTVLTNGDANGGLATFGNLTLNGAYSLSMSTTGSFKASGDANNTALIVEGNVSYSAGSGVNILNGGFVKIKDFTTSKYWSTNPTRLTASSATSQDANPRINLSVAQTQASINADVFDFNTAIANMRSYSTTYKGCSSNTTVSTTATSYTFNLTAGRTNFFKMTASQLALFNEIKFNIVPSATNPVVITVDIGTATTFNWNIPNFPGVPNAAGQYILLNFVNSSAGSTTIYLNGGSTIVGTVFAPNAHVNKAGSGNIEGQVVCMNYTHAQGEVHYQVFNTTVNCSSFSSVTCDCPGGLLKNSGFEVQEFRSGYDLTQKTAYWEWNSSASLTTGSGFQVCDANNAYLYAYYSNAAMWQRVDNITAGTSYTLSAYGGTHEPYYDHRYRLAFYSSTGALLDFTEVQVDWDVDVVPAGQTILKEYVLTKTAPTGTSYLRVEGYASGDWLKLDNLCLTVNNTCNNLTSGGTIGSNQVLCKNVSSTPAALTNVTSPSGGDTGQTIQYQWYRATSLVNGACPTNVAGSSKYTAISGATAATYTPGAISQTTCYIRTARRTNCNDYVAESNAVLVVLKNNCSTVACPNNIVTNSSFETDDNVTNNGKKFPVYFQSSPASYITRTATNTDAYRGASPLDWAIGTDVNDYANQNGAYYIDASVTGNANSGDRFIYGRYNQCVLFAPSSNQKFFPVTPGKKYKICAYMAAFNPSGVQGNADVYFEYKFRNAEGGDKGILSTGDIYQSIPADADGQWETLNWQQYCVEIVAPAGAKYLELYITPRDNEGDGIAIDDICMTEETCTSAPVVSSANICGTGTATLTATGCTGGTVKWYSGSTDTTPIATGATYTPASRSTSLNLFATCTLNNCESMKTPVNLTVSGAVSGVSATAVGGNTSNCGTPITINGAGSVANPNLVYNGDFSAGDIGFVTQYGEQNYGYGVYGVVTDANTYFSWASACKDRTVAGTGKIFVTDGGTDASLTVWGQRIAVNPNTTYRLSTYATSISSTNPSTLAFYVNGVKVGTSTTLSATTCAWQQLTTTWNSGSSTTAYFEIRNENANTGGNDFAIDDISMTVDAPVVTFSWTGPNSFSATTQNITASTTGTYTLTVTGNTGCSSNASIAITINATPSSPTVTPATRCGAGTVTLGATCGSGETAQWYSSQSSTTVLTTGASYSPSLTASTTYYVGCKNTTTSCETPTANRTAVTGTINALPTAPSSSNVTNGAVCGSGVVNLSAVCSSGQTVQWYASQTSTSVLTTGTSYAPSITATTTYYVACRDNTTNCETTTGTRQGVIGTVNPIPSAPSANNVTNGAVCGSGVVNLSATCSSGQTVQWYASQSSTSVLTTGTSYAPSITATTTYYVACRDNTTNCETATGTRQSVIGTVNPIPSAPNANNVVGASRCEAGVVTLTATCTTGQTVQWYSSQSSTSVLTTGTSYSPSLTATTTYYVACRDNTTNCETTSGTRQSVVGTVNPNLPAPSSSNVSNGAVCGSGVVNLSAVCSSGQTVQWYASQTSTSV